MSDSSRLQVTIGGLATKGSEVHTLLGEIDAASGVLLVDFSVRVRAGEQEKRQEDCAVLTDNPTTKDRDMLFGEKDVAAAISDYFQFAGRGLLMIDESMAIFDPRSRIEPDGVDESGRKFRIAPDITNGQIAVMAMCWFAVRQRQVASSLEMMESFGDEMYEAFTVGLDDGLRMGRDGWPE